MEKGLQQIQFILIYVPCHPIHRLHFLDSYQGDCHLNKAKNTREECQVSKDARDVLWKTIEKIGDHSYNQALVAASVGSYGAYLADGSEYSVHLCFWKTGTYVLIVHVCYWKSARMLLEEYTHVFE
nr:homocysteine S-methyltransferase family protein [Tanacetum cinerariifolium]